MLLLVIIAGIIIFLAYKWSISTYDFFEKQGIPFRTPLPLVGTNGNLLIRKQTFIILIQEWYNEFKNEK